MTQQYNEVLANAFSNISDKWDSDIIPVLEEYIRIPNKSPMFDPDWKQHGYMDQAMQLILDWCKKQPIEGMQIDLIEDEGRTPLLLIDIPGQSDETILLYGHMDKQPEMVGWDDDLGPWKPVIKDDKLYGRGGADDGYAVFASLTAIQTLQANNIPHARCVVLIEASEESGSVDLPYYIERIKDRLNTPDLIICLDSEAANYEQLWLSTSIRGLIRSELKIEVLTEGIHSGNGSGVVPSTFMILRSLLERIEDSSNGTIKVAECHVDIPEQRVKQAQQAADILGTDFYGEFPFENPTQPVTTDVKELILNRSWRPYLSVTGQNGLPSIQNAGNVTLPSLEVKLSFRLPPTCQPEQAAQAVKHTLENDPPFNAKVTFEVGDTGLGWNAPVLSDWLQSAIHDASHTFYDKPHAFIGTGGSIPFMGMLGDMFPNAQFFITGVLGPKSNAHGPNEFLHIPMVKRLTGCVASIIAAHFHNK